MPKNLVPNHFESAGIYVEGQRSDFRFNKPHLASFMSGMLVPLGDPIPVFPGVKLDLQIEAAIRSATMVVPPLDGMYIDFFTVWVPHRIVWTHFAQFLGENDVTAWTQSNQYVYPTAKLGQLNNSIHSLFGLSDFRGADESISVANMYVTPHYGLYYAGGYSQVAGNLDINMLSFRGYYFIWNFLFRDENYQRPVLFDKGDTGTAGEFGYVLLRYNYSNTYQLAADKIGVGEFYTNARLMPVNKFHDAFTSVLPQAQFGDSVVLPLAETANVIGASSLHPMNNGVQFGINDVLKTTGALYTDTGILEGFAPVAGESVPSGTSVIGASNLVADLSNATGATINALRASVMYQRYLEALARGGRRVPEYYDVIYGVKNSAAMKDYPLLISRARYALGVSQVVATADSGGTDWSTHLGDTGAYSYTRLNNIPCCEKDFTEFGYLHILYCVRAGNRYSQMIQPHFLRKSIMDEYNPFFDHIGDVAIPNTTVNVTASTAGNFGYQEAWWDERTQLGLAVGAVNKAYGSLKYWVLGEILDSSLVTCTPSYLVFNPATLNDLFVAPYWNYPQFIGDFLIHGKKVARMSQHSIPGIVGRI